MSGPLGKYEATGDYQNKLLTLTCPGKEFREKYTPSMADRIIKKMFNRLMTAAKREFPDLKYLWVCEKQQDGFPHLHVAFIGTSIVPKRFYTFIDWYWQKKCGMGWTWITAKQKDVQSTLHALNYMIKYLGKGLEPIRKHGRIFGCTRGALPIIKKRFTEALISKRFIGDRPLLSAQEIIETNVERIEKDIPETYLHSVKMALQHKYGYGYYSYGYD
jgi:hypothetical protein